MRYGVIKCDRCQKEINETELKVLRERNLKLIDYERVDYDICAECYESLDEWYDMRECDKNECKTEGEKI